MSLFQKLIRRTDQGLFEKVAYNSGHITEQNSNSTNETALQIRIMGRTLLLIGSVGISIHFLFDRSSLEFFSHSLAVAMLGVFSTLLGVILPVLRQEKTESKTSNVSKAYIPGSTKLKRTNHRGKQRRG